MLISEAQQQANRENAQHSTGPKTQEGKARSRMVVLEFPSFAAALACYRSPEYQAAKKLREGRAEADIIVVEGYAGARF